MQERISTVNELHISQIEELLAKARQEEIEAEYHATEARFKVLGLEALLVNARRGVG